MEIFLWGPRGTGKTWLLDSVIRYLNLFRNGLLDQESPFDLWIEDALNQPVTRLNLTAEPTQNIEYTTYTIKRRYKEGDEKQGIVMTNEDKLIKLANDHTHKISMLDGPGDETTGRIAIIANNEDNNAKVLGAQRRLQDADSVIVTIDRGSEADNLDNLVGGSSVTQKHPGEIFSAALSDLLLLLRSRKNPRQKVYLCFTKIDKYEGVGAAVSGMLPRLFGSYADTIEIQLRDLVGVHKGPLKPYFVSALGYYRDSQANKLVPNRDGKDGLLRSQNWFPHNVCEPLFDMLEAAEKENLQNAKGDTGLQSLGRLGEKWNKKLEDSHRSDLLLVYKSYRDLLQEIQIG